LNGPNNREISQDCLLLGMDSNPRTLAYRADSIRCFLLPIFVLETQSVNSV